MQKPWEFDHSVYEDEAELVAALQRRDQMACACLMKRYAPRLYRAIQTITINPDERDDVVQESFIKACNAIDQFEGRSGLGTWLHRIAVNSALMQRRRKATVSLDHVDQADSLPSLVDVAANNELRSVVMAAIVALPPVLRDAIVARDINHLSTEEAAAVLGISQAALKVRLHRARHALRLALSHHNHG